MFWMLFDELSTSSTSLETVAVVDVTVIFDVFTCLFIASVNCDASSALLATSFAVALISSTAAAIWSVSIEWASNTWLLLVVCCSSLSTLSEICCEELSISNIKVCRFVMKALIPAEISPKSSLLSTGKRRVKSPLPFDKSMTTSFSETIGRYTIFSTVMVKNKPIASMIAETTIALSNASSTSA